MELESQSDVPYGKEVFSVQDQQDISINGETGSINGAQHNSANYPISDPGHIYSNGFGHGQEGYQFPHTPQPSPTIGATDGGPSSRPSVHMDLPGQLQRQIEYYLSRENLSHDTYLLSQMDGDQYVDISIIAGFNQVKKLTSDMDLIVKAMQASVSMQVDEVRKKVRPLCKRSVLILRDVPDGTTKEELEEIFNHSSCPTAVACEYISANCWYAYFDTEDQAQEAYTYIRETLPIFKGQRIKARMKAKLSGNGSGTTTAAVATGVVDQSRQNGLMPAPPVDAGRGAHTTPPIAAAATQPHIRYPMPVPQFPVQGQPFVLPAANPFVNYLVHPFMYPYTTGYADPNVLQGYDMNGYGYPTMATNHSRQGMMNNGRHQPERRNHSRASSNTSDRGTDLPVGSSTPSSTTTTAPKNSSNSQYHNGNGRVHNDSGYHKHHNGGGDKHGSRPRNNYQGNHSNNDQYYSHPDNIPPRHRENAHYRLHKQRMPTGHTNNHHISQGNQSQIHSAPLQPRRSTNQQHSRPNGNGAGNFGANGYTNSHHQTRVPSNTHDNNRSDRGNRDHNNRQSGEHHHHNPHTHSRSHGAHRNSKSPDKEVEQQQTTVVRSESFELDSSAFPALPGATTAVPSATASSTALDSNQTADITSDSTTTNTPVATKAGTQVVDSTPEATKAGTVVSTASVEKSAGNVETVAKLSDIVKNNIPEAKRSDIVKGLAKHSAAQSSSSQVKDSAAVEKAVASNVGRYNAVKSHNGPSQQKLRPTHLTNGTHTPPDSANKSYQKSKQSTTASTKPADPTPIKSSSEPVKSKQPSAKEAITDKSGSSSDAKSTTSMQASPTDQKVSYAAMAQKPKTSPSQDQSPAPQLNSPTGDNNNNADNKSAASPTKQDNLYSSTAAKTVSNTNAPRKPAQPQHIRGGPKQQRNNPVTSPASPPSRNPQAVSSATSTVVAR